MTAVSFPRVQALTKRDFGTGGGVKLLLSDLTYISPDREVESSLDVPLITARIAL